MNCLEYVRALEDSPVVTTTLNSSYWTPAKARTTVPDRPSGRLPVQNLDPKDFPRSNFTEVVGQDNDIGPLPGATGSSSLPRIRRRPATAYASSDVSRMERSLPLTVFVPSA